MSTRLVVKRMRVLALGTLFVGAAAILLDLGRAGPCSADQPPAATQPAFTNRLAKEGSPYLQQHAHNPVDGYPWGTEAFEKAKKENKPIFLSIGYSTCHWCHVMEQESFTNVEIAKLINDNFVPIKVDREERPDIDAIYMNFIQATTGSGGWPMTVFLTPDLKPFFGGTYFPPEDLKTLLPKVHEAWLNNQNKITDSADQITAMLKRPTSHTPDAAHVAGDAAFAQAYGELKASFDPKYAGFSTAPKFPRPATLNFLLHYHYRSGDPAALDMVLRTLRAMADGGIRDQLGGGFHRYSTDARWFLPHFEKMLYDQAQLADSYLDAYQITHEAVYADTARDILDYVLRDMTGPEGQFCSAEDADSAVDSNDPEKKAEGAFYVWTADQIREAVGIDAAAEFAFRYGVKDGGNVDVDPRNEFSKKNVLSITHSIDETAAKFGRTVPEIERLLDDAKSKLRDVRGHRPRPLRDDKTLTAWNGLMISAFARAGRTLGDDRYLQQAIRSAEFIQQHLLDAKTNNLTRRWRNGHAEIPGFVEDYAFYIQGLLDLYESSPDIRWLKLALNLQITQDALFWDAPAGGYFSTSGKDSSVLMRIKNAEDNAEPSGNSVAALNLLRLSQMTDDRVLRTKAEQTIHAFDSLIERAPTAVPQMLVDLDFALSNPKEIVVAGRLGAQDTTEMLAAIQRHYIPNRIVLLADGGDGQRFLSQRVPLIADVKMIGNRATAYVCENFACQLPTNDLRKFEALLVPGGTTRPAQ
jgi:uncharacterized protein YyaL (SSP411 family)